MYYELYIDILFLVNFMMDYLLLSLVKEVTKCDTTRLRILGASVLGALLTCLILILPLPYASIRVVLFHAVVNTIMIISGFKIKSKIEFVRCFIFLYICGFLLGGVFEYFQQYMKVGSLFFAMAVLSYQLVRGIWRCIQYFQQQQSKWYDVDIFVGEESVHVKALLDTGNGLYDPYTDDPVHIINRKKLEPILTLDEESGMRYIPYHSLGNQGIMLAVRVKSIHLCGVRDYWIQKPLIALSDNEVSINHTYEMILNPDIL